MPAGNICGFWDADATGSAHGEVGYENKHRFHIIL